MCIEVVGKCPMSWKFFLSHWQFGITVAQLSTPHRRPSILPRRGGKKSVKRLVVSRHRWCVSKTKGSTLKTTMKVNNATYSEFFEFFVPGVLLNSIGLLGFCGNILSIIVLSRPQMKSSINCILIGNILDQKSIYVLHFFSIHSAFLFPACWETSAWPGPTLRVWECGCQIPASSKLGANLLIYLCPWMHRTQRATVLLKYTRFFPKSVIYQ